MGAVVESASGQAGEAAAPSISKGEPPQIEPVKAPFPYFGGKSRAARLVWERFGDVRNYVEPFFGSGAVLLSRPHMPGIETVNDADCMVANFWRAIQQEPDAVAASADWPVNEADQHARHLWLCSRAEFRERMKTDPHFYDTKIAGWWVYGISMWIGGGWCSVQLPHLSSAGSGVHRKRPHLSNAGSGVHRKLPHLGNAGRGVHRKRLHLGNAGRGVHRKRLHLSAYFHAIADRMRMVRVCCGDWRRVCGPCVTYRHGLTGVFLDPPYSGKACRAHNIYAIDDLTVAHEVRAWAVENGTNPLMRIALCGYEGEHHMPPDWACVPWKANGGYGSRSNKQGRLNAHRERIWFSPHCIPQ